MLIIIRLAATGLQKEIFFFLLQGTLYLGTAQDHLDQNLIKIFVEQQKNFCVSG